MNRLVKIIIVMLIFFGATGNIQAKQIKVNLLLNGNFDQGPGIGWTEYSSGGWQLITPAGELPGTVIPQSGPCAWLGGDNNLTDYIYQDIIIPHSATGLTINLYRLFATQETSEVHDQVVLSIRNPITNQLLETLATWSNLDFTEGWVSQSLAISGNYAGMPVRFHLSSSPDSSLNTNFFFDTISLDATINKDATIGGMLLLLE